MKFQWEDLLLTPDYWIPTCDVFQKPVWQPDRLTGIARFRGSVPVGSCAGLRARAGLDNRLRTRQATDIDRLGNPGIWNCLDKQHHLGKRREGGRVCAF